MLTFRTTVLNGAPFYKGTVIYKKPPANSRASAYCGYVNTASRLRDLGTDRGVCVYYSGNDVNKKSFDIREVAKAMREIIKTINNCENERRVRPGGRRSVFGDADAPNFG